MTMTDKSLQSYNPADEANWQPISITEPAAHYTRKMLAKKDGCLGLRLGVKKSGCNGYKYTSEYVFSAEADDLTFVTDFGGLTLYVRKADMPLVSGTVIALETRGLNKVFVYQNPNEAASCGCGESFSIK
jgi:iron-sulfur cluster assembly accessory protein